MTVHNLYFSNSFYLTVDFQGSQKGILYQPGPASEFLPMIEEVCFCLTIYIYSP